MTDKRPMTPELEARFDAELARVARSLVTEDLPRGVLDAGLAPDGIRPGGVRARRPVPAYAGLAAVLVLLLGAAVALVPGGTPPATVAPSSTPSIPPATDPSQGPSPAGTPVTPGTFRSTGEIQADFQRLGFACRPGNELLPTGPSPSQMINEGAVCSAPADAGPYKAVAIIGEARDGRVVELHVKADLTGEDSAAAREAIAEPLAKAVAIAVSGAGVGDQLGEWVVDAVPLLTLDDSNSTKLAGFAVKVARSSSGTYQVLLAQLPAA